MSGDGLKRQMAQGPLETRDHEMQDPYEDPLAENRCFLCWASSVWMEKETGN